jgi:hypothetical protein
MRSQQIEKPSALVVHEYRRPADALLPEAIKAAVLSIECCSVHFLRRECSRRRLTQFCRWFQMSRALFIANTISPPHPPMEDLSLEILLSRRTIFPALDLIGAAFLRRRLSASFPASS